VGIVVQTSVVPTVFLICCGNGSATNSMFASISVTLGAYLSGFSSARVIALECRLGS
jgi:hypothetical protein